MQDTAKANSKRIKELQELQRHAEAYAKTKPIHDQLQQIKFKKRRERFQQDHEPELVKVNEKVSQALMNF